MWRGDVIFFMADPARSFSIKQIKSPRLTPTPAGVITHR